MRELLDWSNSITENRHGMVLDERSVQMFWYSGIMVTLMRVVLLYREAI